MPHVAERRVLAVAFFHRHFLDRVSHIVAAVKCPSRKYHERQSQADLLSLLLADTNRSCCRRGTLERGHNLVWQGQWPHMIVISLHMFLMAKRIECREAIWQHLTSHSCQHRVSLEVMLNSHSLTLSWLACTCCPWTKWWPRARKPYGTSSSTIACSSCTAASASAPGIPPAAVSLPIISTAHQYTGHDLCSITLMSLWLPCTCCP